MPEFLMIMKGPGTNNDWPRYIDELSKTGLFRGGSVLGKGKCISKNKADQNCTVTGFMRFEAATIEQITELAAGNPDYESGGEIEILELVED